MLLVLGVLGVLQAADDETHMHLMHACSSCCWPQARAISARAEESESMMAGAECRRCSLFLLVAWCLDGRRYPRTMLWC